MGSDDGPRFEFDRISTVDQVADALRRMIWRGELQPGSRLKELPLSKAFGVSRNTIRDAIRDLAQDGLLVHELHRGATVRELSPEDVADLYRVRRLLETSAVRQPDLTDDELERISRAVAGIDRAVEAEDWETAVASDRDFHAALVALHRSPRLDRFYEQISAESRFAFGILWLRDAADSVADVLAGVAGEHRSIYDALRTGQPAEAQRLLDEHLTVNETRVLEILEATTAAPS
jgi:DNA-binding GntR family transcriptional regulator